jgi:serine/threonine-protein kinase TTK/MPS1
VMEHGEIDLSDKLKELKDSGSLDENYLRMLWSQMLQAVLAIHRERIIHGDLKPANFLFVNGALKLIDFGIAKAISNDTTNIERDSQVGTVNYMSPEAIQGNTGHRDPSGKMKVGRASDIWSLGCILYQIVYGQPPFADAATIIDKFRCIVDENYEIQFPALKNKDLEDVMRSCLRRDHKARLTIDGENGLLNHPFLRSRPSDHVVVSVENASSTLQDIVQLCRSTGMAGEAVDQFARDSEPVLKHLERERRQQPRSGSLPLASSLPLSSSTSSSWASVRTGGTKGHHYDTQERRTDI